MAGENYVNRHFERAVAAGGPAGTPVKIEGAEGISAREREVPNQTSRTSAAIARLAESIYELERRLESVLRSSSGESMRAAKDAPVETGLARQLHEQACGIEMMRDHVESILGRLEV